MNISSINFRSNQVETVKNANTTNPVEKKETLALKSSELKQDVVEIGKNKEDVVTAENFKRYSCKGADELKYDLEYTKPSFFNRNYDISGEEISLSVKNKLLGVQNVSGIGYGEAVNIDIDSGVFASRKGTVTGTINGKTIVVKYRANENAKSINLSGNIEDLDEKSKNLLIALISDKIKFDSLLVY